MTPRAIRRAAERRANKLARKSIQNSAPTEDVALENTAENSATESFAQTAWPAVPDAAAANTQLSALSSTPAGHQTLFPAAEGVQYAQLLCDYQNEFQPVGLQESNLVQALAEHSWRVRRTVALESSIFAQGRIEFASQFAEHNPDLRLPLIDLHTFLVYEKQIRGLQLQDARLSRRSDKASAELRTLQQERRQREEHARRQQQERQECELAAAASLYQAAKQNRQPFDPAQNGFEFSNRGIECYLAQTHAAKTRFTASRNNQTRAEAA